MPSYWLAMAAMWISARVTPGLNDNSDNVSLPDKHLSLFREGSGDNDSAGTKHSETQSSFRVPADIDLATSPGDDGTSLDNDYMLSDEGLISLNESRSQKPLLRSLSDTGEGDQECNWQCYLNRYLDLLKALGENNTAGAQSHWQSSGQTEGRDCTCPLTPSPPAVQYTLGGINEESCVEGSELTSKAECEVAFAALGFQMVTSRVEDGQICYVNAQGKGRADGIHAQWANFNLICKKIAPTATPEPLALEPTPEAQLEIIPGWKLRQYGKIISIRAADKVTTNATQATACTNYDGCDHYNDCYFCYGPCGWDCADACPNSEWRKNEQCDGEFCKLNVHCKSEICDVTSNVCAPKGKVKKKGKRKTTPKEKRRKAKKASRKR